VFRGLDLSVRRGDRISIVGLNGAGKTTLLKLMAHEIEPKQGEIVVGHNVELRYFAQHHADTLRREASVLQEVWSAKPEGSETEIRTLCGAFLFSGDDVEKPIGVLSGGERARVALAKLLARPGNALLLDEPTNHLDTESAAKLTESLESYDGTLIFVSHDLDFARRLSNRVWDVKNGSVEIYPGSLGDYLERLADRINVGEVLVTESASSRDNDHRERRITERQLNKALEAERRKRRSALEKSVARAEAEISALEREKAELEAKLADPATVLAGDPRELVRSYDRVRADLEAALARWEKDAQLLSDIDTQ
jgi:ATP-binding cassette, subfamily F, member 3